MGGREDDSATHLSPLTSNYSLKQAEALYLQQLWSNLGMLSIHTGLQVGRDSSTSSFDSWKVLINFQNNVQRIYLLPNTTHSAWGDGRTIAPHPRDPLLSSLVLGFLLSLPTGPSPSHLGSRILLRGLLFLDINVRHIIARPN